MKNVPYDGQNRMGHSVQYLARQFPQVLDLLFTNQLELAIVLRLSG